jgi:cysteinyl-tRNA synthetase
MALAAIGPDAQTLDLHAGGVDLIFPHHEDEIAQSEAATARPFVRYWVHGEFLNVRGTKMSKRFGNFLTARDLRDQGVDAAAVRLLFWQTHYRQPLDFTDAALDAAREGVKRLGEVRDRLTRAASAEAAARPGASALGDAAARFDTEWRTALDDDLNAPRAVGALFDCVRAVNRALDQRAAPAGAPLALRALERAMTVLDVWPAPPVLDAALVRWVNEQVAARERARKSKDFKEADRLRALLRARGVELEDTPDGTKWRRT